MKQHKCKRIAAFLLAALLAAMTASCSSGTDASSAADGAAQDGTSAADTASEGGEAAEPVELYWYSTVTGWGPSGWSSGVTDSPLTTELKERFGITLKYEQPPTDADTKLGLMIATNDLPDLISLTNSDTINELIASGGVYTMPELLETYDPESHLLVDFPEDIKQKVIDTFGDWWSLPSHLESPDMREVYSPVGVYLDGLNYGHNSSIMFNKTMMDELGITLDDVLTEEGFYEACEKVKNSGYTVNGQAAIPVMLHGNLWINSSLDGIIRETFGVVPVDGEGHYRRIECNPGYKYALNFVNQCIRRGYLDVNSLTQEEAAIKVDIEGGRVFCWIGNPAQSGKKEQVPWVTNGPILASTGADPVAPTNLQAGLGWIQTFVSKSCENPEAAAKLLSFGTSEEGLTLNEYGVEGVDFNYESGVAIRTEEGQQRFENDYANNMALWPFANTDFAYSRSPEPDETMDTYYHNVITAAIGKYETTYMYDSGLLDFANGTVLNPTSDLGIQLSQVENYLESQKAKIVSATTDEEFEQEYQNMIDTLNSYQIDAIDAEYDKILQENYEKYGETIENVNFDLYG